MYRWTATYLGIAVFIVGTSIVMTARADTTASSMIADNGAITVPAFDLPPSVYASSEYQDYVVSQWRASPPKVSGIDAQRQAVDARFFAPKVERLAKLYPYTSTKLKIQGVPVEEFTSKTGIAPENEHRVLVNLHGGGFVFGGGLGGAAESIEMAALGRIKVISVDYRMAPEHRFPAASEDLATVYRELLKTYRPENIGIYGCSAGGVLAAEAVPWFQKERLPVPGAIGIFCASAHRHGTGDSAQIWPRMQSTRQVKPFAVDADKFDPALEPYFAGANPKDPLVVPAVSADVLKAFPPTLFITGSRAPEMSGAIQSHLELIELGVKSQLLIFDGMEHGFVVYPIPEATRAYKIAAKFFMENLGASPLRH